MNKAHFTNAIFVYGVALVFITFHRLTVKYRRQHEDFSIVERSTGVDRVTNAVCEKKKTSVEEKFKTVLLQQVVKRVIFLYFINSRYYYAVLLSLPEHSEVVDTNSRGVGPVSSRANINRRRVDSPSDG